MSILFKIFILNKMLINNYDLKKNKYTNSDYLLLLNGINKVKQYYQGRTRKHNINHIIRVIIYIQIISKLRYISSDDIKILIESALYHDIERISDMADKHHGLRAAESYLNTNGRNLKQRYIAFIIEFHEIVDNQISINRLLSKYNLNGENKSRIMELACILKDADALDRVRLSNPYATLNLLYLRFQESFSIIIVAKSLCYFE